MFCAEYDKYFTKTLVAVFVEVKCGNTVNYFFRFLEIEIPFNKGHFKRKICHNYGEFLENKINSLKKIFKKNCK